MTSNRTRSEALTFIGTASARLGGGNGGDDRVVIELNRQALDKLSCEKRLEIVPGATHLFEEPGALEHAVLAVDWFLLHMGDATHG